MQNFVVCIPLKNSEKYFRELGLKNNIKVIGSYDPNILKMDNFSIGYNYGSISNKGKAKLRISGTVQNLFTITKYTGLDPEIPNGIDKNLYPRPRTITLGINIDY